MLARCVVVLCCLSIFACQNDAAQPLASVAGSAAIGGSGGAAAASGAFAGAGVATISGTGAAGTGAVAGSSAPAAVTASAMIAPLPGVATQLSGTAVFTKRPYGVDLSISVTGCTDGKSYPVHIHDGASCTDAASQGGHWGLDPAAAATPEPTMAAAGSNASAAAGAGAGPTETLKARGEGIPDIVCSGTMGTSMHKRSTPDPRGTWSILTDPRSNVVGHVLVVHDGSARIACGLIGMP